MDVRWWTWTRARVSRRATYSTHHSTSPTQAPPSPMWRQSGGAVCVMRLERRHQSRCHDGGWRGVGPPSAQSVTRVQVDGKCSLLYLDTFKRWVIHDFCAFVIGLELGQSFQAAMFMCIHTAYEIFNFFQGNFTNSIHLSFPSTCKTALTPLVSGLSRTDIFKGTSDSAELLHA